MPGAQQPSGFRPGRPVEVEPMQIVTQDRRTSTVLQALTVIAALFLAAGTPASAQDASSADLDLVADGTRDALLVVTATARATIDLWTAG